MDNLVPQILYEPGEASLENFEELKTWLEERIAVYNSIVYTPTQVKEAKKTKSELKKLKDQLDEKRKEIKRKYMEPYEKLEKRIKELTALIDEPLKKISSFIDQEKDLFVEERRKAIEDFFMKNCDPLGEFADAVFHSPAFYDKKWDNQSTSVKAYQNAVLSKIFAATHDLETIRTLGGQHIAALMNRYFETLSTNGLREYRTELENVETAAAVDYYTDFESVSTELPSIQDNVIGYKILKISGTRTQMSQLLDQIKFIGMEFEELEDGMPKEMAELAEPDFDSFVAFDIETTGTFGAAKGDAPAEITEIGAVKVINGEIVEQKDWLCNPRRKIVPQISRLTHITDDMLADKPDVNTVMREFAAFVGDMPLVGHNIKHSDLNYISYAAKRAGVKMESSYFDTYLFAKQFKQQQEWDELKLEYLSEYFGIEQPKAHRAYCDAEANAKLFFKLKELK